MKSATKRSNIDRTKPRIYEMKAMGLNIDFFCIETYPNIIQYIYIYNNINIISIRGCDDDDDEDGGCDDDDDADGVDGDDVDCYDDGEDDDDTDHDDGDDDADDDVCCVFFLNLPCKPRS